MSAAVRFPDKWVLVDLPGVDSLRDLRCVAAPMGPDGPDIALRCHRKVFASRVWCRLDRGPGWEVEESVAMPSKYERRLTSLTCSKHVEIATWVHPSVRVVAIKQSAMDARKALPLGTDMLLLALNRAGYRPEPLGDLAWVAHCPRDGALLLISDTEGMSCPEECTTAEVMRALTASSW